MPRWKAYRLIDRRLTRLRLVNCVDALIARAQRLLQEEQESNQGKLAELRANPEGERSRLVKSFLADLEKVKGGSKDLSKIEWQKYDQLVFAPNEPRRLLCGDHPADPRVICYGRALEILVEASGHRNEVLSKAAPLLEWVASLGNPDPKYTAFIKLVSLGGFYARKVKDRQESLNAEKKAVVREQVRNRKRRERAKIPCRKSVTDQR